MYGLWSPASFQSCFITNPPCYLYRSMRPSLFMAADWYGGLTIEPQRMIQKKLLYPYITFFSLFCFCWNFDVFFCIPLFFLAHGIPPTSHGIPPTPHAIPKRYSDTAADVVLLQRRRKFCIAVVLQLRFRGLLSVLSGLPRGTTKKTPRKLFAHRAANKPLIRFPLFFYSRLRGRCFCFPWFSFFREHIIKVIDAEARPTYIGMRRQRLHQGFSLSFQDLH